VSLVQGIKISKANCIEQEIPTSADPLIHQRQNPVGLLALGEPIMPSQSGANQNSFRPA